LIVLLIKSAADRKDLPTSLCVTRILYQVGIIEDRSV
jgi:hypothetical protein